MALIPKKVRALKRFIFLLFVAALIAGVITGIFVLLGLVEYVPHVLLRSVGTTLEPWYALFLLIFIPLAIVAFIYEFFRYTIIAKAEQAGEIWAAMPPIAQALFVGLPFALLAAVSVIATDVFATSIPLWARAGIPLLVWVVVTVVAVRQVLADEELRPLVGLLSTATLAGVGLSATVMLFDRIVDSISLPGYAELAVLLVSAPVIAILMVRNEQRERTYLSSILIRTGFAQVRKIQTATVATAMGFLIAAFGALLVSVLIDGFLPILLSFLILWVLATYLAIRWFRRTDIAYSDLVIVDVRDRSGGQRREVAVVNERDQRVDLRDAKIRDTQYDLYRTNIDVILAPGQTETFDVPPGFSLFPATDNVASDLPAGLSLSKSADAPVIVTRNGEKFKLRWAEGVAERAGHPQPSQQQPPAPEADRREERA